MKFSSEYNTKKLIKSVLSIALMLTLAFSADLLSTDFCFADNSNTHSVDLGETINQNEIMYAFVKYEDPKAKVKRIEKVDAYVNGQILSFDFEGNDKSLYEISVVTKNEVKTFSLKSNEEKNVEDARDIASHYYSMDWETANSDLGFGDKISKYTVNVKVAEDFENSESSDLSGSKNHYYFQLVFKKGKSAYVLANSFIENDEFISGKEYSFDISTNEDMGDVIAVNIIADDKYSKRKVNDSLNIEEISVLEYVDSGINRKFIAKNVGTVSLPARNIISSDAEIENTYPIDYAVNTLGFEFAITTGEYSSTEQFEGSLKCDVDYVDVDGNNQTVYDVDVVKAIYDYQNTEAKQGDTGYFSNPETMFRSDRTDRFIIYLDNAVSINSVTLKPYSKQKCQWTIKNLSISLINSKYTLHKNSIGEYQNKYENKEGAVLITDKVTNVNLPYVSFINENTRISLYFEENTFLNSDDYNTLNVVPRYPESVNDTLNIYVYLDKEATDPTSNGINLSGKVEYTGPYHAYSNIADFSVATSSAGEKILYARGVNANNFISLSNLSIFSDKKRDSENDFTIPISYAILEQVRNNVVIDTYTIQYGHSDVMLTGSCAMITASTSENSKRYQEVGISFGDGSSISNLVSMNHDVAVSIKYTSKNDFSSSGHIYSSPYVYLTDQGITSIKPGSTVNLKFYEGYIDQVVGLEVITTGGVSANIDSGYVATYEDSSGKLTGWYGIENGGYVSTGGSTFDVSQSADSVKPVSIIFETKEMSEGEVTGTTHPVAISIEYLDNNGATNYKDISDIGLYLSDGQTLEKGGKAELSVLLPNLKEITSIMISPEDSWYVDGVTTSIQTANGVVSKSVKVGKKIYAKTPYTVNMTNILVKLSNKYLEDGTIENKEETISVKSGEKIQIKTEISGTISGYGYDILIEKLTNEDGKLTIKSLKNTSHSKAKGTIEFTVPDYDENVSYRVTVSSEENPVIKSVININPTK